MFGPLLLHVLIFCKLNYVFANGHLEIHRVLNCDARWSLPGRESVVWWWQATRAHFCWMAGWVEKLRTWCISGLNVPFSCACHDHQPLCTHGEQIRKHSPEPQILFWSVPFFLYVKHFEFRNGQIRNMWAWAIHVATHEFYDYLSWRNNCDTKLTLVVVVLLRRLLCQSVTIALWLSEQGLQGDGRVGQTCLRRLAHAWFLVFGVPFFLIRFLWGNKMNQSRLWCVGALESEFKIAKTYTI